VGINPDPARPMPGSRFITGLDPTGVKSRFKVKGIEINNTHNINFNNSKN